MAAAHRQAPAGVAVLLIAAAGVSGAEPDYELGAYCRLDPGRGQYVTVLLSPPDADGMRRLRLEDNRPTDRAGPPVEYHVRCTLEPAVFRCGWGLGRALELERGSSEPIAGHDAYLRVGGRIQDPPRLGPEPVSCFVKRPGSEQAPPGGRE